MIAMAYHHTVLPVVWKTIKGGKGHVKGILQKELLRLAYYYFSHQNVVVLGDAEFSNEQVITWLRKVGWAFVLRFQSSYKLKTRARARQSGTIVAYLKNYPRKELRMMAFCHHTLQMKGLWDLPG